MTKPSYEELRIAKHSASPQAADSAPNGENTRTRERNSMKTKRKWHQRMDGEWFVVPRLGHRIGCCDCGLVHRFDFKIIGNRIWIRAFRDQKATNGKRTKKGLKIKTT